MEIRRIKRKVLLLGDGAVGKTSLIRKFVLDKFDDKYITTIGTKITKKVLDFNQNGENIELTLMIWDVLGQKGYTSIQASSYKGAEGVLFVCDLTRPETLASLEEYWMTELNKVREGLPMLFVGNKVDLIDGRRVSREDLEAMADKYDTAFFMSSAKTGENVEQMFTELGRLVIEDLVISEKTSEAAAKRPDNIVDVTDLIINEFCDSFGDRETAMAMIRQQFSRAGVDVKAPTKAGLLQAVEYLADVERDFRDVHEVTRALSKRKNLINQLE